MTTPAKIPWSAIERSIRHDPGGRGVAGFCSSGRPLLAGDLEAAAISLASLGRSAAIATGFCVVDARPPAAETDGPPGALYLAQALLALGVEVELVTDRFGRPVLEAGCDHLCLPRSLIREMPIDPSEAEAWIDDVLPTANWTHLLAIERVGPSHTVESLVAQPRSGPPPIALFDEEVPPLDRGVCHNMRGTRIDFCTAPVHRLFERAAEHRPRLVTIGIGDGGNELGMGKVAWEVLRQAIAQGPAARTACRIATDFAILAGVSDWGAYALAETVWALRDHGPRPASCSVDGQRSLIERLVRGGAVDGLTGRATATVDGLPLEAYLDVLRQIQRHCPA